MPNTIEPVLLACVRIETKRNGQHLTNATGFFFERESRLYVITSRHVVTDAASGHEPDSLDLVVHTNQTNLAETKVINVPLLSGPSALWKEASDAGGIVDAVAVPIDHSLMPASACFRAFNVEHLCKSTQGIEVGDSLIVVGFPLGFHDSLHELPVARASMIASSFSFRFQGQGYFLTDGRLHRGASGSPVLKRMPIPGGARRALPWMVLGIHSARLDMRSRNAEADEALGLNVAWYADVIRVLTAQ